MTEAGFISENVPGKVEVKAIKVEKVKPPRFWPCFECQKPTRSHRYPDGTAVCHECFEKKTEAERDEYRKAHSDNTRKVEEQKV